MKIGILGSGQVGQALAAGFLGRGDEVKIGTREAQKLNDWKAASGDRASVGSFAETVAFGEIVVIATLGTAAVEIVTGVGAAAFAGKTVIDVTNPLTFESGKPELTIGFTNSNGESVQRALPNAYVVKAFNTVGAPLFWKPQLTGGPADMFIAGNDSAAKVRVSEIVRDFGWNPVDMGGIEQSRSLEVLCMVWLQHGVQTGHWTHALKMLH